MLEPPCPRLHAGGSDHLSRVMVTIPRVELGGIPHRLLARPGSINFKVFLVAALLASIALVCLLYFGNPKKSSSLQISRTIQLLAAAGLREPIEEIARKYEAECGVKVDIQFGGSNSLLSQIKVDRIGTPDLLLVADEFYTQKAVEGNLAREVLSIAVQRPCVIVPKDSTIQIRSLDDLMVSGRRLSIGNPDQAAIGKAVREALQRIPTKEGSNQWQRLESQVSQHGVFKPTVNEVANDVRIGAVDAGIVWNATVSSPAYRDTLRVIELPELSAESETVSMAVLASSTQPTEALQFARYVSARNRGLEVFKSHGLEVKEGDDWAIRPEINFYCGAVNRRVIEPILEKFQEREGVVVNTVYDGCGILTGRMKTIQNQDQSLGFPDLYMACDRYYLDNVKQWFQEDVDISDIEIVMVVPKGATLVSSPKDLLRPGIRVAIGQPDQCTIGALTKRLLDRDRIYESLIKKQREPGETVVEKASSALLVPDVLTGHVDVAIAYLSDVIPNRDKVDIVHFEDGNNVAIQPLSVASNSRHKQLLRRFYDTVYREASSFESKGFHFRRSDKTVLSAQRNAAE